MKNLVKLTNIVNGLLRRFFFQYSIFLNKKRIFFYICSFPKNYCKILLINFWNNIAPCSECGELTEIILQLKSHHIAGAIEVRTAMPMVTFKEKSPSLSLLIHMITDDRILLAKTLISFLFSFFGSTWHFNIYLGSKLTSWYKLFFKLNHKTLKTFFDITTFIAFLQLLS